MRVIPSLIKMSWKSVLVHFANPFRDDSHDVCGLYRVYEPNPTNRLRKFPKSREICIFSRNFDSQKKGDDIFYFFLQMSVSYDKGHQKKSHESNFFPV